METPPSYPAELEPGQTSRPWRSVAVIGAGSQGRAFALRCVQAGYRVVLEDVLASRLRSAAEQIGSELSQTGERLSLATSVEEAVREADVAIDFVPDELESKLEIFSMMDRMAPPKTVFCTPTKLSIGDLASCTYRAAQCAALRLFEEEGAGTAVELVRAASTGEETVARLRTWLEALGFVVQTSVEAPLTDQR